MELIKRLFGGNGDPDGHTMNPAIGAETQHAHDFAAQLPTRRELLRVRTRNTLRMAGIPEAWVEPQVLLEPGGGRTFLHLRLVVRHWDERLFRYAIAFQTQLMAEIERIDPQARQWLLSIVWCFPHDMPSPYPDLPQPSAWLDAHAGHAAKAVDTDPESNEVQSDLARLFAVRDAELKGRDAQEGTRGS
jgi:hypothetical protein